MKTCCLAVFCVSLAGCATGTSEATLDNHVRQGMQRTGAQGLAIAVIRNGAVTQVRTWGKRNARGESLTPDTVMYGASLTKAVFAYTVMQLVDEGKLDLDTSIAAYLPKPLPEYTGEARKYAAWEHLGGDERWRTLTPRVLLTHSAGFSNFGFLEPDEKLRFHFDPGSGYAYSGEGMILLQFVIERGLGLDLGKEMQRRVFDRFGMRQTSMTWRPDFAGNLADGWKEDGSVEPHDERSKTRAAGSMDTTITDFAKFAAAYVRGDGLRPASRMELTRPAADQDLVPIPHAAADRPATATASGSGRRPGCRHLQGTTRPRLSKRRAQRFDGQYLGLPGTTTKLCRYIVERRAGRTAVSRNRQTRPWRNGYAVELGVWSEQLGETVGPWMGQMLTLAAVRSMPLSPHPPAS